MNMTTHKVELMQQTVLNKTRAPIRVLVVDDHQMFAESLVRLLELEDDIEVVGSVSSAARAEEWMASLKPDVVLLDHQLPDGSGVGVTPRLLAEAPDARIVLVTGRGDRTTFKAAMEAGCAGFVSKEESASALVDAVRVVHGGDPVVPRSMLSSLLPRGGRAAQNDNELSGRETEVLELLAQGLSTEDLCEQLFLSRNTVRAHVQHVISKLGAHSKLEAVAIARRRGLV